jgi:hypothetical protein
VGAGTAESYECVEGAATRPLASGYVRREPENTVLVLWFARGVHQCTFAAPPLRPWYPHKRGMSFADVLRAAQRVLAPLDVLDPGRSIDNLRETQTQALPGPTTRFKRAA